MGNIEKTAGVGASDSLMLLWMIYRGKRYRKNTRVLNRKSITGKLNNLTLQLVVEIEERGMSNISTNGESANSLEGN